MKINSLKDPRSEFLLGISLSEIAFIFFILLLLITVYWIKGKNKEIQIKNERIKNIETEIQEMNIVLEKNKKYLAEIQNEMGISKEEVIDFQTKLVNISKLENEISILKEEVNDYNEIKNEFIEIELNHENLKNILKQYQSFKDVFDLDESKLKEMENAYELNTEIEQQLIEIDDITKENVDDFNDVKKIISKQNEKIEELKFDNLKSLTRLNYLKNKIGTGLWDDPPCFISKENKSQYIYKVEIYDDYFVVSGAWENERDKQVKDIPGAYIKQRTYLKINEFKVLGSKLKKNAKENQCHHYVKVVDKTTNDKNIWKKNLSILEQYFYKRLM